MRFFLIISALLFFGVACTGGEEENDLIRGQLVKVKLTGDIGMVQDIFRYGGGGPYVYHIRLPFKQESTDTHIFGKDGPIRATPLAIVKMRRFELEPVK